MAENERTEKLKTIQGKFVAPILKEVSNLFTALVGTRIDIEYEKGDAYEETVLKTQKVFEIIKKLAQDGLSFIK